MGQTKIQSLSGQERFEKAVKPLMDFLMEDYHPHVTVIVTSTTAELMEGLIIFNKND